MSTFSAWPFSVPSLNQSYPLPPVPYNNYSIASATTIPGTYNPFPQSIPSSYPNTIPPNSYQHPQYIPLPPNYGTYNPLPIHFASVAPTSSNIQNYPSIPSYNSPYYPPSYPSNNNSTNQMLILLLSQLITELSQQSSSSKTVQNNINGNKAHNETTVINNGDINTIINNFIINPENVNIAGINTGTQINNNKPSKPKPTSKPVPETKPTTPEKPKTYKYGKETGYLQEDGNYHIPAHDADGRPGIFKVDPNTGQVTQIQKRQSPLTLDLNGDGKINTTAENRSDIDIDADGQKDTISQIKDDGMLFIDPNHTGKITSGAQLLGNHTQGKNFANGFDALKSVAKDTLGEAAVADGKLDTEELGQLETKLGLGIEVNGEMKSLADFGITELKLDFDTTSELDAFGNEIRQTSTAKKEGKDIRLDDIWFVKQ